MTQIKETVGRLPIYIGEYDSNKTYKKKNRVTLFGSEFQSLIDNNTYAPATLSADETHIIFDEVHWKVISNGSDAFLNHQTVLEKLDEIDSKQNSMQSEINGKQLEIGAVQTDVVPTQGSANHMTSGAIYETLKNPASGFVKNTTPEEEGDKLVNEALVAGMYGFYTENPEWIWVVLDSQKHVLGGFKPDGEFEFSKGVPTPIRKYITVQLENFVTEISNKVDKEEGKGLIIVDFADGICYEENPEWVFVQIDNDGKLLSGIKSDGTNYIAKLEVGEFVNLDKLVAKFGNSYYNVSLLHTNLFEKVYYHPNEGWKQVEYDSSAYLYDDTDTYNIGEICNVEGDTEHSYESKVRQHDNYPAYTTVALYVTEKLDITQALEKIPSNIQMGFVAGQIITFVNNDDIVEKWELQNNEVWERLTPASTIDHEDRISMELDAKGRILSYRSKDGTRVENVGIKTNRLELTEKGMNDFQKALKDAGFNPGGSGDWTDKTFMQIPEPRFAIINFTSPNGNATWPTAKGVDLKYYMEFYDGVGNYFKKEVIMNAQGNSSMAFLKKNGAIDLCNNNGWDDEDTFSIKFGDWVAQDSFHLKAFPNDFIIGSSNVSYHIADKVEKDRGPKKDRPWKKVLLDIDNMGTDTTNMVQIDDLTLQLDTDAKCHPDGFPVGIYMNGDFYGVYVMSIKKHRDNYHMEKDNPAHIHLDGDLTNTKFWYLDRINWTGFEVRNPKDLIYQVPLTESFPKTKKGIKAAWGYDADVRQAEIAGISSPDTDIDAFDDARTYAMGEMCKNGGRYFISITNNNISHTPTACKKPKNVYEVAAADGYWMDITHTNAVKLAVLNLCTRMCTLESMSDIDTPNGVIRIGDYGGIYNATANFSKGVFVSDGNDAYYMSLHTTNTGHSLDDAAYWIDVTQEIAAIKVFVERYFDVENLIDYEIVQMVTGDTDGFGKNWQWLCYDSKKWFVSEYDKDMSFGNHYTGQLVTAPIRERAYLTDRRAYWLWGYLKSYPVGWVVGFYQKDIKERWQELYNKDIITAKAVVKELTDWCSRIGKDYYDMNYSAVDKVNNIDIGSLLPCNRDDFVDKENWGRTGGRKTSGESTYDSEHTYQTGETCWYGKPGQGWLFEFRAKKETTGNPPITAFYDNFPYNLGYRDSIWRFVNYIEETISLQNDFVNSLNV